MVVVPMVFAALTVGVYELGRGHDLRGIASRTFGYTVLLSTVSVAIAVAAIYAEGEMGMSKQDTMLLIFLLNIAALIGAWGLGWLQDHWEIGRAHV